MIEFFRKIGYSLEDYWTAKVDNQMLQIHCLHLNKNRTVESHGDLMDDFFDVCNECGEKFKVL